MERFDYWTKQRVDVGLQRFINDFYEEQGRELPASSTVYRAMILSQDSSQGNRRKYPSVNAVLRFYESFSAAWWKFGFLVEVKVKNPKYPLTPEREEMMHLIYQYKANGKERPEGVPAGAKEYAVSLGYPPDVGSKWAVKLGLAHVKEHPWSESELAILDEFGYLSVHQLQIKLKENHFPRSETAIHLMRRRRMAAKAAPYYSFTAVAKLLGVDSHLVKEWAKKGWLKYVMKGTKRSAETNQNGDTHLTHKDWIYQFLIKHPKEFTIRNSDQLWLFHILTKGEVGLGFETQIGKRVEGQQIETVVEHRKKKQTLPCEKTTKAELPKDLRSAKELAEHKPHGHHMKYIAGCRCDLCKRAYAIYDKNLRDNQKSGNGNPLVSAESAQAHINFLSENDFGYLRVSKTAKVNHNIVWKIKKGERKKIRYRTEQKILSVTLDSQPGGSRINATETIKRIDWLKTQGLSLNDIARLCDFPLPFQVVRKGRVRRSTADKIEELYLEYKAKIETPELVESNKTKKRSTVESLRSATELAANKPHGTRIRYIAGCKCDLCRKANTQYNLERERAKKRGEWNGMVSAEQARNHLLFLRQQGIGRDRVHDVSGVCVTTISKITNGTKKLIRAYTEQQILAVDSSDIADWQKIDAGKTWERINWLRNQGYTKKAIALGIGKKTANLQIGKKHCTKRVADQIEQFYLKVSGGSNVEHAV